MFFFRSRPGGSRPSFGTHCDMVARRRRCAFCVVSLTLRWSLGFGRALVDPTRVGRGGEWTPLHIFLTSQKHSEAINRSALTSGSRIVFSPPKNSHLHPLSRASRTIQHVLLEVDQGVSPSIPLLLPPSSTASHWSSCPSSVGVPSLVMPPPPPDTIHAVGFTRFTSSSTCT